MKSSVDKSEGKTTNPFSHYLHTVIRRRTFVPENHVRVIMQDNMFYDILPTGYYRINRWKYTLGPEISIGLRSASLDVSCYSRDGVHVRLKGRVLFRFDPNLCDRAILPEIVKLPESVLGGLGKRNASRELRHVVGDFSEIELKVGRTRSKIEEIATWRMKESAALIGIAVIGRIDIEHIAFPSTDEGNVNQTIIKEQIMGDQYTIGQAGAVGPNAHAHDMNFNQIWSSVSKDINLAELSKELSLLRNQMKKEAKAPDHDVAIGAIAAAEASADEGDGVETMKRLSKAGKWALSIAEKIGVPLAMTALSKALGL